MCKMLTRIIMCNLAPGVLSVLLVHLSGRLSVTKSGFEHLNRARVRI